VGAAVSHERDRNMLLSKTEEVLLWVLDGLTLNPNQGELYQRNCSFDDAILTRVLGDAELDGLIQTKKYRGTLVSSVTRSGRKRLRVLLSRREA